MIIFLGQCVITEFPLYFLNIRAKVIYFMIIYAVNGCLFICGSSSKKGLFDHYILFDKQMNKSVVFTFILIHLYLLKVKLL